MKVDFKSTVGEIAELSGGRLVAGDRSQKIKTITTDSRATGKSSLFIPIVGERFDGHKFIEGLVKENKIAGFLTQYEEHGDLAKESGKSAVLCGDTLKSYGLIASGHRRKIKPFIVGITGTNGKTTTKELLWTVLSSEKTCLKNEKNYNNEVGVPYTLLGLQAKHKYAVIEMGMNHTGEIGRLTEITRPDMAIITNIGEGHLEYLNNLEGVAGAKSEIMEGMPRGSLIFLNKDSNCFNLLKKRAIDLDLEIKSFGLTGEADITPDVYRASRNEINVSLNGEEFNVPMYGKHNIYNILAVLGVAFELGIDTGKTRKALKTFSSVDKRSQVIDRGYVIINDTYNSNPLSSRYALESVKEIFTERRKIAILGDMKELGGQSEFFHRELGRLVHENGFNILLTWGEMASDTAREAVDAGMDGRNVLHFDNKEVLIDFMHDTLEKNDVVLVKGSRSMKMEEVVEALIH